MGHPDLWVNLGLGVEEFGDHLPIRDAEQQRARGAKDDRDGGPHLRGAEGV